MPRRASEAMNFILIRIIQQSPPNKWREEFQGQVNAAYNLECMFREDLELAKKKFRDAASSQGRTTGKREESWQKQRELFLQLLDEAIDEYGDGLVDPEKLVNVNFTEDKEQLITLVMERTSAEGTTEVRRLLGEMAAKWIRMRIDAGGMPLTPHHTQCLTTLMCIKFYEQKQRQQFMNGYRALICEMKTGEGKSITIQFLAACAVLHLGKRVHVLQNNSTLLKRDFRSARRFFDLITKRDGSKITCGLMNASVEHEPDICYCLKKDCARFFNAHLLKGDVQGVLDGTILIVDEVDDLIVNEAPMQRYSKVDHQFSPQYKVAYDALIQREKDSNVRDDLPDGVHNKEWLACQLIKKRAEEMKEGTDYELTQSSLKWCSTGSDKPSSGQLFQNPKLSNKLKARANNLDKGTQVEFSQDEWDGLEVTELPRDCYVRVGSSYFKPVTFYRRLAIDLAGNRVVPKETLTADWLLYLNYRDHPAAANLASPPLKESFYSCLCLPFMYNKYACIFGLTGTVGGQDERDYLEETFGAVAFDVPQFLNTCPGDGKKPPKNRGVTIVNTRDALVQKVVERAKDSYRKVPVLIITRGRRENEPNELNVIYDAVREGIGADEPIQILRERDDSNADVAEEEINRTIADATSRCGTGDESKCYITVTDHFGGRGHDFECKDDDTNDNGGMLVIATSIPETREWVQWKGRTARQVSRSRE